MPLQTRVAFDHMKLPGNWSIQEPCDILASALLALRASIQQRVRPPPSGGATRGQPVKRSLQAIRRVSGSSPASGLRPPILLYRELEDTLDFTRAARRRPWQAGSR